MGWPAAITYDTLVPYYERVAKFMNVQKVPANQWNPRMKLMQEGATKAGFGNRSFVIQEAKQRHRLSPVQCA